MDLEGSTVVGAAVILAMGISVVAISGSVVEIGFVSVLMDEVLVKVDWPVVVTLAVVGRIVAEAAVLIESELVEVGGTDVVSGIVVDVEGIVVVVGDAVIVAGRIAVVLDRTVAVSCCTGIIVVGALVVDGTVVLGESLVVTVEDVCEVDVAVTAIRGTLGLAGNAVLKVAWVGLVESGIFIETAVGTVVLTDEIGIVGGSFVDGIVVVGHVVVEVDGTVVMVVGGTVVTTFKTATVVETAVLVDEIVVALKFVLKVDGSFVAVIGIVESETVGLVGGSVKMVCEFGLVVDWLLVVVNVSSLVVDAAVVMLCGIMMVLCGTMVVVNAFVVLIDGTAIIDFGTLVVVARTVEVGCELLVVGESLVVPRGAVEMVGENVVMVNGKAEGVSGSVTVVWGTVLTIGRYLVLVFGTGVVGGASFVISGTLLIDIGENVVVANWTIVVINGFREVGC